MEITFIWSGHDLADAQKQEAQANISSELDGRFTDLLRSPITVHLFHDLLTSVISGVVLNKDDKQVIKITRQIRNANNTSYDPI